MNSPNEEEDKFTFSSREEEYVEAEVTDRRILLKGKDLKIAKPKNILICANSFIQVDQIIKMLHKTGKLLPLK